LEDSGVNGRIILRWIFMKWDLGAWNGWSWLRIGQVANTCECGNEALDRTMWRARFGKGFGTVVRQTTK